MLKILAIILMTLDHIGHYCGLLLPNNLTLFLRFVGRFAFPIFAWYLACGYQRTRNVLNYALRLLGFGFISEAMITWGGRSFGFQTHPNVFFTLAAGVVAICAWDMIFQSGRDKVIRLRAVPEGGDGGKTAPFCFNSGISLPEPWGQILGLIVLIAVYVVAYIVDFDYDVYGITTILIFHMAMAAPEGERITLASLWFAFMNILFICGTSVLHSYRLLPRDILNMSQLQALSVLAMPIIAYVPDAHGRPGLLQKYFFYAYYPLHILLIMYFAAILLPRLVMGMAN